MAWESKSQEVIADAGFSTFTGKLAFSMPSFNRNSLAHPPPRRPDRPESG
jgi:hypothetical protein